MAANITNINLENWYLDLEKMKTMDSVQSDLIHSYYRDMLFAFEEQRPTMGTSLFLTLQKNGYLKDIRGEKLENLLDD
jgi:hypothetical protein